MTSSWRDRRIPAVWLFLGPILVAVVIVAVVTATSWALVPSRPATGTATPEPYDAGRNPALLYVEAPIKDGVPCLMVDTPSGIGLSCDWEAK